MFFEMIANLNTVFEKNDYSRIHEVIISSEKSLKEVYAQVGSSVFSGREQLNSIHRGTTYFGSHCPGFFGCLTDHLYILDKEVLPSEMFEFHLISAPKDENKGDFVDFVVTLMLHRISEEYGNNIRILAHRDFIENMSRETDWGDIVDERSIPIDPYAQYLRSQGSETDSSTPTDIQPD